MRTRCTLVNWRLTIKGESVALIDRRERRSRATEDARDSPSFWLSKLKHEYETEAHTYRDYQNYRHVFKMLNCRSAVVDWQQTRSDFDVTSTMLKSIANAMYIF
ncbi:hypothetical protein NP493_2275g00016 [Ridgeia piscesae]|uniref:Uncharacterized protein n=2 Tax=Ridgeia piscesae TaxID=27915 RepID=A0AAD9JJ68_RIDPI|nr:hypothetical protein NP493_2275g00016 [Ridgeia piscesae]